MNKEDYLNLYRKMYLIRLFEESCGENYSKGFIRGFLHLYIGQEAVAVGSIDSLEDKDFIVTHYRDCLLYTSPSPRDNTTSRMPSSA